MKIERVRVFGFEPAFFGMRNPKESWDKSDSFFYEKGIDCGGPGIVVPENPLLGEKDLKLACNLIAAGKDHRKFIRQIMVWVNITLPRAVWTEVDTYKVGTVRNSCSTMYRLGHRDLVTLDFQDEEVMIEVLDRLNALGRCYRSTKVKDKDILHKMKMHLPESYLQMATFSFSYETALSMYHSRCNHRMPEWSGPSGICEWLSKLPYMRRFLDAESSLKLSQKEGETNG